MEVNDIIKDVINNEKSSPTKNDSVAEQKSKLKRQINQLKSIILQIEWSSNMLKFGNTKCVLHPNTSRDPSAGEIPDVNVQLQCQLYRYSGFHCVKFSKDEYVFNFSSLNKYDKSSVYAIQILNNQDIGSLGKWVMPMAIDLKDLVSEIPINQLKNVPHFLRTCKHYIDCYSLRHEQYVTLQSNISRVKNCNAQTNLGYTQIILNLTGVHDNNNDTYMNVMIHLLYNIGEARPYKIEIDSATVKEFEGGTKTQLETSLARFKKLDLCVAFETMLNEKRFTWAREDDDDSPVDVNMLSDSDGSGFLEKFSFLEKSSTSQEGRRKVKRKRKQIRKEKLINLSSTSKHNKMSIPSQSKERTADNDRLSSAKQWNAADAKCTPNVNEPKQRKLKQKKLTFQLKDTDLQNSNGSTHSEITSLMKKREDNHPNKAFTSTPIHYNKQSSFNPIVSSSIDISDITFSDNNTNGTKAKVNKNAVKENTQNKNDQLQSNAPVKLLQNKMKRKIKSVQLKS